MIIPSSHAIPSPTFNPPTPTLTFSQCSAGVLATLLGRDGPEIPDVSRYRTTTNIVLSCLSTIFACTWVALHLDVPKVKKGMMQSFWRKLGWTLLAVVTPEFIAMRAMGDLIQSKEYVANWNTNFVRLCSPELIEIQGKTAKQYKHELQEKQYDSRWTLTHGFLAKMDGIMLYDDCVAHPQSFKPTGEFFQDLKMRPIIQQIGLISPEDIKDKSKGDWISKLFVVNQTTWFIAQCLARWAAHLPVTELEVVTLAYAVLNIIVYILWWKKPKDISVPYRFYLEKDEEIPEATDSEGDSKVEELPLMARSPTPNIANGEPHTSRSANSETRHARSCRDQRKSLLTHEWIQLTHSTVLNFLIELQGNEHGFWLIITPIGAIFGALHLIPIWLSVFPSGAEKTLWQVSTFFVTAAPVIVALSAVVFSAYENKPGLLNNSINFVASTLGLGTMAAYAAARVLLLVLSFTTLRSLPAETFLSVEWTRFIPHF